MLCTFLCSITKKIPSVFKSQVLLFCASVANNTLLQSKSAIRLQKKAPRETFQGSFTHESIEKSEEIISSLPNSNFWEKKIYKNTSYILKRMTHSQWFFDFYPSRVTFISFFSVSFTSFLSSRTLKSLFVLFLLSDQNFYAMRSFWDSFFSW